MSLPIDNLASFLKSASFDLEEQSGAPISKRSAIARRILQAAMSRPGLWAPRFADFHSHWDGILPVDHLIELWIERAEKKDKMAPEEEMFLDLSAAILNDKGKPTQGKVPGRGAHLLQFVIIYVWWWAFLTGVRNYDDEAESPGSYGGDNGLWKKTTDLITELYELEPPSNGVQRRKIGRIFARRALKKYLQATKTAPFDDAYVARSALMKLFKGRRAWDDRTIEYLVEGENIGYLQVSQATDKIDDPAKAVDEYNKTAEQARKPYLNVRWLALLASHHSACKDGGPTDQFAEDTEKALEKIKTAPSVIGIDWAGPEGFQFDQQPTKKAVTYTLDGLYKISKDHKKRTLLFRPHVGEGSSLPEGGRSLIETKPNALMDIIRVIFKTAYEAFKDGNADDATKKDLARRLSGHRIAREILRHPADSFKVLAGEAARKAADRAGNNVGTLLNAIVEFKPKNPDIEVDVRIRFGHVTHATERQGQGMRDLDIAADINLGSNLRTGALAYMESLDDADNVDEAGGRWNWAVVPLARHSLKPLCDAGVRVVLGSDGQGVEVTNISIEYDTARQLVPSTWKRIVGANVQVEKI